MINARVLAYQVLLHLEQKVSHPDRLIRTMLDRHPMLEDREKALLTELVYGVLRWQGKLDWHLDQLSTVKPGKISREVRILLRLGLYQILMLDRVPPHAAVNESVNLAKKTQPAHVAGFVNAVLRGAIRRQGGWEWPSAERNPDEYLAVTTSHPKWAVQRFLRELGAAETEELLRANNTIAPLTLRVNPLKAGLDQTLQRLHDDTIRAEPSPYLPNAVRVTGIRQDVFRLEIHRLGWVQVQDEASQLVSLIVAPEPGEKVLDLCAGFGAKSTHLAELMGNRGEILAVDISAWKLEELQRNTERQGVEVVRTLAADLVELQTEEVGSFDRVLLDAPCSGFGTLRRNPDIKWRRHPKDPWRFSSLQKTLLDHASQFVKKGGILVYATCSLFSEENDEVAKHFSDSHPGWIQEPAADYMPESCRSMTEGPFYKSWPHRHGTDGFFGARWRRME